MTGASGFLAGYVATAFAEAGAKVDGLDRNLESVSSHPARPAYVRGMTADLCDTEAWARWVEAAPPDLVVHLAGPADVAASFDDPTGDLRAHLDPLLSLYSVVGQLRAKPRVRSTHPVLASTSRSTRTRLTSIPPSCRNAGLAGSSL